MKKKYLYSIIIFIVISCLFVSCKKEDNFTLPTVKTYAPVFIASTSVTLGVIVESGGGTTISECGIYISLSPTPESTGQKLLFASDTGVFIGQLNGISPATKYYFKGFARNSKGESLGEEVNFTTPATIKDFDNNVYETVGIGTQMWMARNLKATHYQNGDLIGTTNPSTLDISAETSPKYLWSYGGDEANTTIYGKLYTYYAVTDTRKVCPAGWHIPTDGEWTTLETTLGGYFIAGSRLKEAGNTHWKSPYNLDASNETCFTALPGGYRVQSGTYSNLQDYGYWWSSTESDVNSAWVRSLFVQSSQITRSDFIKKRGASVRCIKD